MGEPGGCRDPGTMWAGFPLLTQRLRLRPLDGADIPAMVAALADGEVARFTGRIPMPYGEDDARAFLDRVARQRGERSGVALGIERTLDRRLIGAIGVEAADGDAPEIGYWLARDCWGQGYATEAVRRLLRHLFADLGYARVRASARPENGASLRVLEKVGMEPAGETTATIPARGETVSLLARALSGPAWRAAHAARPHVLVVAAALIDEDGRVLVATRPPGRSMAGLWEFPGGKVAAGETPEEALVRELAEELGIDTGASCLAPIGFVSHDYDTFHLLMPLYALRVWRGRPDPREGQHLAWVRPSRLGDLPMPPADIPLVAMLQLWV